MGDGLIVILKDIFLAKTAIWNIVDVMCHWFSWCQIEHQRKNHHDRNLNKCVPTYQLSKDFQLCNQLNFYKRYNERDILQVLLKSLLQNCSKVVRFFDAGWAVINFQKEIATESRNEAR